MVSLFEFQVKGITRRQTNGTIVARRPFTRSMWSTALQELPRELGWLIWWKYLLGTATHVRVWQVCKAMHNVLEPQWRVVVRASRPQQPADTA